MVGRTLRWSSWRAGAWRKGWRARPSLTDGGFAESVGTFVKGCSAIRAASRATVRLEVAKPAREARSSGDRIRDPLGDRMGDRILARAWKICRIWKSSRQVSTGFRVFKLPRQARGHRFEPCLAHFRKSSSNKICDKTPRNRIGVELDGISDRIARAVHPEADIRIENFRDTRLPEHRIDAVIGMCRLPM